MAMEILMNHSAPVDNWAETHAIKPKDERYAYSEHFSNRKDAAIAILENIKKIGLENFKMICFMIPNKYLSENIINFLVFEIHAEAIKQAFLTADEETSMIYGAPEAVYLEAAKESKRCHELLDLSYYAIKYSIEIKEERMQKKHSNIFFICLDLAMKIAGDASYMNSHVADVLCAKYDVQIYKLKK